PRAAVPQRLRTHLGELAREEAAVVADHERVAIDFRRRLERARRDGNGIGHAADVVEGEAVRDDGAPAVGAEGDVGHRRGIVVVRRALFAVRYSGAKSVSKLRTYGIWSLWVGVAFFSLYPTMNWRTSRRASPWHLH